MTIKNAGLPLSMSDINQELGLGRTTEHRLGWNSSRKLAGTPQSSVNEMVYRDNLSVQWPFTSFIVPANVTMITFTKVIGGGGGGGGFIGGGGNSDTHAGGGGGAGGWAKNARFDVVPGDVIGITVGRGGGAGGVQMANGTWIYDSTSSISKTPVSVYNGGYGEDTVITRNGATIILAAGGDGGTAGGPGDNCLGASGLGGGVVMHGPAAPSPEFGIGCAGGVIDCTRNSFSWTLGGWGGAAPGGELFTFGANGSGGTSWATGAGGAGGATAGLPGLVEFTYTLAGVPISGQISMSQFYGKTKTY